MKPILRSFLLLIACAVPLCRPPAASAIPAVGITVNNALIQFDTSNPLTLTAGPTVVTGLQPGETILGIDLRPADGRLYALGSSGRIYTVDLNTAAATPFTTTSPFPAALSGTEFGVDFDPDFDYLRIVSDTDQSLYYSPNTGMVTTAAPLAFAPGDVNAGDNPNVTACAYTNGVVNGPSRRFYGIDFTNQALVAEDAVVSGRLHTVGRLDPDMNASTVSGFDIAPGSNLAFAAFNSVDSSTTSFLSQVNLTTGVGTFIDRIGPVGTGRVRGVALLPASTIRLSAAAYSIQETTDAILIPVFRTGDSSTTVTVDFKTFDGTATSAFDYRSVSGTLSFAPGETIKEIRVEIISSSITEPAETFQISLFNPATNSPDTSVALENPRWAAVTINDGPFEDLHVPVYLLSLNNVLFTFPGTSPSLNPTLITGLAPGERILAIDFRPATGQLYGLGDRNRLYLIDAKTAVATQVGSDGAFQLSGDAFGFDFNPVVDRIRVTSESGQNLRINPNDGTLTATDTPLAFDTDSDGFGPDTEDPYADINPNIAGSAYTNSDSDPATGTTLYNIEVSTGTLVVQDPPNAGTLKTVGRLGIDLFGILGFDIFQNVGIGVTSRQGQNSIFALNLTTGQVEFSGPVDFPDAIRGVALGPAPLAASSAELVNISARALVQTDDDVAIGGFIIRGDKLKHVIIRGLGASLKAGNTPLPGRLANPTLTLHESAGETIDINDDWQAGPDAASIAASGLAPTDPKESALEAVLPPGSYTAILRGVNMGTGIGLIEIYDLDGDTNPTTTLANISSRAFVSAGDNVLINGIIVRGMTPQQILFRAIGPDLATERGVVGALDDPTMDLFNENGALLGSNDDWRGPQEDAIRNYGLAPDDDRDPAILITLGPGLYTTVIRGKNGSVGVALGEVYRVGSP